MARLGLVVNPQGVLEGIGIGRIGRRILVDEVVAGVLVGERVGRGDHEIDHLVVGRVGLIISRGVDTNQLGGAGEVGPDARERAGVEGVGLVVVAIDGDGVGLVKVELVVGEIQRDQADLAVPALEVVLEAVGNGRVALRHLYIDLGGRTALVGDHRNLALVEDLVLQGLVGRGGGVGIALGERRRRVVAREAGLRCSQGGCGDRHPQCQQRRC